jgi:AcrR family transcriptional regulator
VPRVSAAHLAARRQQILDAAQTCFLRNGFHATSMQDVIAEAGLSIGAVYRYFKGKNEIVEAIALGYADQVGGLVAALSADPDRSLADVMAGAIGVIDDNLGPAGPMRLAVQVWSEALRDERVGAIVDKVYGAIRASFVSVAERAAESGELDRDLDPEATGAALFALVIGYGLQKILTGRPDKDSYVRGVRAILGS